MDKNFLLVVITHRCHNFSGGWIKDRYDQLYLKSFCVTTYPCPHINELISQLGRSLMYLKITGQEIGTSLFHVPIAGMVYFGLKRNISIMSNIIRKHTPDPRKVHEHLNAIVNINIILSWPN